MKNINSGTMLPNSLAALQVLIGIGAVAGGYMLLSDTSGSRMGFTLDLLDGSPFSTYLIPGAFLLGAMMMGWIIVQVLVTGPLHWLQPLYFVLGLVESVLGLRLRRAWQAG